MDKNKAETQVDTKFLKLYTNKFDVETIFTLNLQERNISSVGNIPDCSSLILLDLTQNNLRDISGFIKLSKIQVLKLGRNYLTNIDSLKNLTGLISLDLHGNQLKQKNLQVLAGLPALQTLYLQTLEQKFKNPVCDDKDYRKNTLQLLPQVKRLDGINKEQDFTFDAELPEIKKLEFKMDVPTQYWYTKEYPGVEFKNVKVDDSGLKDSISSCNKMMKELEDKIKSLGVN